MYLFKKKKKNGMKIFSFRFPGGIEIRVYQTAFANYSFSSTTCITQSSGSQKPGPKITLG